MNFSSKFSLASYDTTRKIRFSRGEKTFIVWNDELELAIELRS
jgi:hypothetical protein